MVVEVSTVIVISQLEKRRIIEILDSTLAELEAGVFDGLMDEKILTEFNEIYAILGAETR